MKLAYWYYKILRIFYASYFYYFMPFTVIWIPYLYEYGNVGILDRTEEIITERLFDAHS
jgi:hypothetical protein